MVMSPVGIRPEKNYAGEAQQQRELHTFPLVREGAP
jgi:hypothetical protein